VTEFLLLAYDPDGGLQKLIWHAAIVPRTGDTLMLWDGSGHQDVTVEGVSLYRDGAVEVWLEQFAGWEPGSVRRLFDTSQAYRDANPILTA
jgi:hypothetical protein